MQDFKNNQPYQDNNELKEAEMPLEEHEEALLPESGDGNFEAENEVPLIPCRINEAEHSSTKAVLYTPSVEYANASPLAAKESEEETHHDTGLFLSSNVRTNCPIFPESY